MKYAKIWNKTLNENEKVEYEFSLAKRYRTLYAISVSVLGLILIVVPFIGVVLIIAGPIVYWALGFYAYAFTSKRVLIHTGWLSTKSTSIAYDKIVEVSVDESFLARVFYKSGTLVVKTAGFGHDIMLKNIESPYEVKKILDRLSHKE